MGLLDKAKDLLGRHDDTVDEGLDKAGEAAKERFGHDSTIDNVVEQGKEHTGQGDTTSGPAPGSPPEGPPPGDVPPQQ